MGFRFHQFRRYYEHEIAKAPSIQQAEAQLWFEQGRTNELIRAHAWIACDLAARALHQYGLPSYLGAELATVGTTAIGIAFWQRKTSPGNFAAYAAKAAESAILEYIDEQALIRVPSRTQRDRHTKKMPRIKTPRVIAGSTYLPDDAWRETKEGYPVARSIEHAIEGRSSRNAMRGYWADRRRQFETLADFYPLCRDGIDVDMLDLIYDDGAGPRCLIEVAGVLGLPHGEIEARYDDLEKRTYVKLDRPLPRRRRRFSTRAGCAGMARKWK